MFTTLSSQDSSGRLMTASNARLLAATSVVPFANNTALVDPLKQTTHRMRASAAGTVKSVFPDPGGDFSSAYNLGVLNGRTIQVSDAVNTIESDGVDFYRFQITSPTQLNLALTHIAATGDADVDVIWDRNNNGRLDMGETLRSSVRGSGLDDFINLQRLEARPDAPNYYVQVRQYVYANGTAYRLTLSDSRLSNVLPIETDIGTLNGTRSFGGQINADNTADAYRFVIHSLSNLTVGLTGLTNDADVRLIRDANDNRIIDAGDVLVGSTQGSHANDAFNRNLLAGTYFVQVYQYNGDTNYSLRLTSSAPQVRLTIPLVNAIDDPDGIFTDADYYARVAIAGRTFTSSVINNRNNIAPTWSFVQNVSSRLVPISIQLWDEDINPNDHCDINPRAGARSLNLTYDIITDRIYGDVNGSGGQLLSSSGGGDSDRARLTFRAVSGDWYRQMLLDGDTQDHGRRLAADGQLSRTDMIELLRATKDGSVITATELTDLRTLVAGQRLLMPDYVFNLSNKVVNGNVANRWWTGGATARQLLAPESSGQNGNLYGGARATHLERLLAKWFFGLDRPAIPARIDNQTVAYRSVGGNLFQNGIQYQDIDQGALGDCYFCAALAGAAFRRPTGVSSMFIDNQDGTFTVRFYNNGRTDYVTVDRFLPTYTSGSSNGRAVYMGWGGGLNTATTNELWTALAERAYAQINESGWLARDDRNQNGVNSYAALAGGWPDTALHQITAQNTVRDLFLRDSDRTNIINQFNAGRTVFLNWADHALTMVGYNAASQLFTIYNPWGQQRTLTWQQIRNGGNGWPRFTDWSYSTT